MSFYILYCIWKFITVLNYFSRNSGENISQKAPSVVLVQPDGFTLEAFGYEAEDRYAELVEEEKHEPFYFFQHFKMFLYENEVKVILYHVEV